MQPPGRWAATRLLLLSVGVGLVAYAAPAGQQPVSDSSPSEQTTGSPVPARPESTGVAETDDQQRGSAPGLGTVTGVVLYDPDPSRPWRLARYYVKNPQGGPLAEAVVALSGASLPGSPSDRPSRLVTIDQRDFQFTPETVAIQAGDRVEFLNSDPQTHNVRTMNPLKSFNVNMPAGGRHEETFARAGGIRRPIQLGCVYHSAMRGWVFVFDHPHFQVTGTDGAFRLVDVPPGEYQLEVVHPAGAMKTRQKIRVRPDETVTVELHPQEKR